MTEEKKHPSSSRFQAKTRRRLKLEVLLDRARRLRRKTKDHPVTDYELRAAKQMGRL